MYDMLCVYDAAERLCFNEKSLLKLDLLNWHYVRSALVEFVKMGMYNLLFLLWFIFQLMTDPQTQTAFRLYSFDKQCKISFFLLSIP